MRDFIPLDIKGSVGDNAEDVMRSERLEQVDGSIHKINTCGIVAHVFVVEICGGKVLQLEGIQRAGESCDADILNLHFASRKRLPDFQIMAMIEGIKSWKVDAVIHADFFDGTMLGAVVIPKGAVEIKKRSADITVGMK